MHGSLCRRMLDLAAAGLFGLCLLAGMTGCQSRVSVSDATRGVVPETVLVLPFQNMAERYPRASAVRSPMSGKVFPTGPIMDGAETLLTDHVISLLEDPRQYAVLRPGRARAALSQMSLDNDDLAPDREMIVRIGRAVSADAVLAGFVYRFRDRVGTAYGVDSPASVAFDLHLVQMPDGRIIWSTSVDDTQQSLSENLLQFNKFVERRGRWVTAPDMARKALDDAFVDFP